MEGVLRRDIRDTDADRRTDILRELREIYRALTKQAEELAPRGTVDFFQPSLSPQSSASSPLPMGSFSHRISQKRYSLSKILGIPIFGDEYGGDRLYFVCAGVSSAAA